MHECEWLDALVHAANHWADELKEDPECKEDLYQLCKALKGIHYIAEIAETKLMDRYRESKAMKL